MSRKPHSFDSSQVGAYILAGGASQRMGRDKARLGTAGRTLVEVLAERLRPVVAHVAIVAKAHQSTDDVGIEHIVDSSPERAVVHGIRAALAASGPPWRFILGCDMPNVDALVLFELWRAAHEAKALGSCPRLAPQAALEPLPSLWHASVATQITEAWGLKAQDWLRQAGLAVWDAGPQCAVQLLNVNTPQDWQRHLASREGSP